MSACLCVVACSSSGTISDGDPPAGDGGAAGDVTVGPAPDGQAVDPSDTGSPGDAQGGDVGDSDAADAAVVPRPTYTNPLMARDFPDPFVYREGTTYYAFATNAGSKNVQAATSTDLATWTALPDALPVLPSWAAANAGLTWAPSLLKRGATYVLYYTARDKASGFQCLSHAESATPAGPYVDSTTQAFVCQVSGAQSFCGSIDPSPFVDTDGTAYLVWKSDENASACARAPRLWSAPLSADGASLTGPATALLTMDQTWEQPIIEGPSMTLHGGIYFLVYSANAYESAAYAMGYATCLAAGGPCKKVTTSAPFVQSEGTALGPGGGEFFTDPNGGTWLAYHAWTAPETTYSSGGERRFRIDRIAFDGGTMAMAGPTTTPQPLP